jgi:hypothetical protein
VAGGIILLGIGLLIITGWWWPGIMLVLGVALAVERLMRGRYQAASLVAVVFIAIPLLISAAQHVDVPVTWVIGFVVAALGIGVLIRAITHEARQDHHVPE